VPTQSELEDLEHKAAQAFQDMDQRLQALDARVTALEAGTPPDIEEPPVDPPATAAAVTISMAGHDYIYDPADGVDIGAYTDPAGRFVMSCIRVKRPDCRLVLDFRATPMADGAWSCVVFEYSDPTVGGPNLAYSASIDGTDIVVADHWLNSSWRWQSCPWPHPLTPIEDLYTRKLLPRFDGALALGKAGSLPNVHDCPPMSLCGFTPDMGATGGRADIGTVTGWQGEYLCTGGTDMLKTVIVQGEAAFNWRLRDNATGATFDAIKTYPNAWFHWGSGANPQLLHGSGWHPGLDAAHSPACYYVPFLLTGDPYFLEYQQGECMYHICESPRSPTTIPAGEQVRGYAWMLRTLLNTVDATPDDVPSWLLPKQLFVDELERIRGLFRARQDDGWVYRNWSHVVDSYGRWQHAWWQHDYVTAIAAWASLLHDSWAQQRDYMVEGIAGRNSPTSGWCHGYPTSYWTNTTNRNDYYPEGSFTSWLEAWSYNSQYVYTDTPGGYCCTLEEHLSHNTTYDYFSAMMHALRLASQAGCAQSDEVLEQIEDTWNQGLMTVGYTEYKYCAAPQ
jgi:hypothetical protein